MKKTCFIGAFALALFCLGFASTAGFAEEIEVKNPSFEITNPNGMAQVWSADTAFYSIEYGAGRTGNAAMRWDSDDKNAYKLCSQAIAVEPGACVECSAYVKTENVKNGGATIALEYSSGGKWIGGAYSAGVKETQPEWTKIAIRSVVPENAERVTLLCYVTRGGTGTAWFDDVQIKDWIPPFLNGINTDHYRHITDGSDVTVRVGVSKKIPNFDLTSLTDPLVVSGDELAEPVKIVPSGYGDDYLEFVVPTDSLAPGTYTATFSTRHPMDGSDVSIQRPFTRVEQYPTRKTFIDEHRRAIVDGEPFFPLGCYFSGVKQEELDIYADSGFNCLMPYHPINRSALDACSAKNIKVIYSVKDNFPGLAVKTAEEGIENTKRKVAEMKDHPAIFAWYINDELPFTMLDELTARRNLMEELDPGRPTWVVLYQIDEIRGYIPTFDVIGTDPYPISSKPASLAASFSQRTNDAVFRQQAVWQVPQIFNWASYKPQDEKEGFRAPTYDEIRSMAWMSIAGGANGLVFYSWFDLWKMDKTVADGGTALVREPFDERWADVKKMAAEIAEYIPVLLAVENAAAVAKDESPDVITRLYGHEGKTWALVVNTANEPRTCVLNAPSFTAVENQLGGAIVSKTDASVTVELKALEPCFIVFTP